MARRLPFTQAEVARVIKACESAGQRWSRVEVDPVTGRITLHSETSASTAEVPVGNPWDEVLRP
jgi:hypothetical protein